MRATPESVWMVFAPEFFINNAVPAVSARLTPMPILANSRCFSSGICGKIREFVEFAFNLAEFAEFLAEFRLAEAVFTLESAEILAATFAAEFTPFFLIFYPFV